MDDPALIVSIIAIVLSIVIPLTVAKYSLTVSRRHEILKESLIMYARFAAAMPKWVADANRIEVHQLYWSGERREAEYQKSNDELVGIRANAIAITMLLETDLRAAPLCEAIRKIVDRSSEEDVADMEELEQVDELAHAFFRKAYRSIDDPQRVE